MKKQRSFLIIKIVLLTAVIGGLLYAMNAGAARLHQGQEAESMKQLENSIRKATMTCYATEGVYPPTLEYLKKGGRLSPAAATLAGLLKIKPILTIQGEKLDKYGTSRTMKKARKMMIDQVKQDISDRGWGDDYEVACVYSYDKEAALDYLEQVKEAFPDKEVIFDRLSLSVACHIGPGSLAGAAYKKGSY